MATPLPQRVHGCITAHLQDLKSPLCPNFHPAQLVCHHENGRSEWSWNQEDLWEIPIVGQVVRNKTYLGVYGDMISKTNKSVFEKADFTKSSWVFSLQFPSGGIGPENEAVIRQFEFLEAFQQEHETTLNHKPECTDHFCAKIQGGAYRFQCRTHNIFQIASKDESAISITAWPDEANLIKNLTNTHGLSVVPLNAADELGNTVLPSRLAETFKPGTWVEAYCSLRLWDNCNSTKKDAARFMYKHSYQLVLTSVQKICDGDIP